MAVTTPAGPAFRPYPVHVQAQPRPVASRWTWLVKWLFALPHYVVLAFLWLAFVVLSAVALVAIVATGRYPRAVFEFNVGVLRWSWRVAYYSYGALATDRYPPFTLAEDPDYPAHLSVEYPQHLSRGLALVKWWLLAIPHYLVVAVLVGGGATVAWTAQQDDGARVQWGSGLVGILVLVAAVLLAVTGSYPRPLYDLLLGLHRWMLRVAAYAGLMTDQYPPFRLDQGPDEPDAALAVPAPGPGPGAAGATTAGPATTAAPLTAPAVGRADTTGRSRWTAGPVVAVVSGTVLALLSLGLLTAGAGALVVNAVARDADGYVGGTDRVTSTGYAAIVDDVIIATSDDGRVAADLLGEVRVTVTPIDPGIPVFAGIARERALERYLPGDGSVAPAVPPASAGIWEASTTDGELVWTPERGRWSAVVMNADGTPGVAADVRVAAEVPWLGPLGPVMLLVGLAVAAAAVLLVTLAVRAAGRP